MNMYTYRYNSSEQFIPTRSCTTNSFLIVHCYLTVLNAFQLHEYFEDDNNYMPHCINMFNPKYLNELQLKNSYLCYPHYT